MNVDPLAVLVPMTITLTGLFLRSRTGSSNHWDVLHELARGRVAAGMERERRATLRMVAEGRREASVPEQGGDGIARQAGARGAATRDS